MTDDPGKVKVITRRGCKHPERILDSTKSSVLSYLQEPLRGFYYHHMRFIKQSNCMIVGWMEGREEQDTIAQSLDGLTELYLKTGSLN